MIVIEEYRKNFDILPSLLFFNIFLSNHNNPRITITDEKIDGTYKYLSAAIHATITGLKEGRTPKIIISIKPVILLSLFQK